METSALFKKKKPCTANKQRINIQKSPGKEFHFLKIEIIQSYFSDMNNVMDWRFHTF